MVPCTPIAVKPPSPTGASLRLTQPGHPGSGRGRPSCTRPRPRSSSLMSRSLNAQARRIPSPAPRRISTAGNPQATGQRRKPNTALSPIGATYAAQPSISAATSAELDSALVTEREAGWRTGQLNLPTAAPAMATSARHCGDSSTRLRRALSRQKHLVRW